MISNVRRVTDSAKKHATAVSTKQAYSTAWKQWCEFNAILGFVEQLNEVDVDGIEPMTSVTPMRLKRREDQVTDGDQQNKVLANAADAREGFFAVPKVVE